MAVMRNGSVRAAARALGVSQPAVTKSLRLAEQAAGFVLFRRVNGRIFPSTEAETLFPRAERLQNDFDAISLLVRQLREGVAGSVTVAATTSVARPFVTPAVVEFRRKHPNIQVEVMILSTASISDRIASSQADFGVVHQPTDNPALSGEIICEGGGVCVLPKQHALARRRKLGPQDLLQESLICFREDTPIGQLVRKAVSAAGQRREVDIVVNQDQQALDLVEAGAGVAVMDPFLLIADQRPSLATVPFQPAFSNRLRIIRARERPRSHAATQLEAVVRKLILKRVSRSSLARPVHAH